MNRYKLIKIANDLLPNRFLAMKNKVGYISRCTGESKFMSLFTGQVIISNPHISDTLNYVNQLREAFKRMSIQTGESYVYPYSPKLFRQIPRGKERIVSITPDFGYIIGCPLIDLIKEYESLPDSNFKIVQLGLCNAIQFLANKIYEKLSRSNSPRDLLLSTYFSRMIDYPPHSLDEAIQKFLFFEALFWQAGHRHIGKGRLDLYLYKYYQQDIQTGNLTRSEAKKMIKDMVLTLGKDTIYKSQNLRGDTGQYILLGGVNRQAPNTQNELTEIFLEIFTEIHVPDPKLILRVNKFTSDKIWELAINCLEQGTGSPLIMNEDVITKEMESFGYRSDDLFDLGTSACWEPLVIGKSFDQNNPIPSIVSIEPLNILMADNKIFSSFDAFYQEYKNKLKDFIVSKVHDVDFDVSPLLTLFCHDCTVKGKDFSLGGARYAYHGIQIVSFPNTINALLNIREIVYKKKIKTLSDCYNAMCANYLGYEDVLLLIKNQKKQFGKADDDVIDLTNDLQTFIGNVADNLSMNGNKVKVGFSSPAYIDSAKNIGASFDGRRYGEPFAVHISPISSDIDIFEILDFASSLNYSGNRINGNVVDFILPNSYLKNKEKLIELIKQSCMRGIFELQLNVLSYKHLIDAKAHPEKYKNLIVRVWGFSAYFNDLPDDYKDTLIERTRLYGAS